MADVFKKSMSIKADDKKVGISPDQLIDWLSQFKGQGGELRVVVGWKGQVVQATLNWP